MSVVFFSKMWCSYHVVDNIDVVGDPAHLLTLLDVHSLWISSSQNGSVGVSLQQQIQQ